MKRIACIFLICIFIFALTSCSEFDENYEYDGRSLIGKWYEKDYDESYYIAYEFFENGSVEQTEYYYGIRFGTVSGAYTVNKNVIEIDLERYDGTVMHYEHKFCITDKGELMIVYLSEKDQMTEEEMVLVPYEDDFNEGDSKLLGTWEDTNNPGEMWTFNEDFTGTIANEESSYKMHYAVHNGKLYMAYEFVDGVKQSLVEFKYRIKGDTLTMESKIDGTKIEYSFERK
ncbi:MAG: hypothetical protein E7596_08730 [Ruminococcaceae bacterium]|nr:hypothetical protein [Oscillospiraceae bacterium]